MRVVLFFQIMLVSVHILYLKDVDLHYKIEDLVLLWKMVILIILKVVKDLIILLFRLWLLEVMSFLWLMALWVSWIYLRVTWSLASLRRQLMFVRVM